MNAEPGGFPGGAANWVPRANLPNIAPEASLPALPTPSAMASTITRLPAATATAVMLADKSYAQMMAEHEARLSLIKTGVDLSHYIVVGLIVGSIVVLAWVLVVKMRTPDDE